MAKKKTDSPKNQQENLFLLLLADMRLQKLINAFIFV